MRISDRWQQFEVISASNGKKLEKWGNFILSRPDPQVIWHSPQNPAWATADAEYSRSETGGGSWSFRKNIPQNWTISYNSLKFKVSPTGFKHTGLFPEQAVNWDFMQDKIKRSSRKLRVLNLFAYTGGATLACAKAGASVCHVDASKGMVSWARDNARLSGLEDRPIRWIVDDCKKFVEREIRRGNHYDGIIMDPPSYGRGPGGEVWKLEESINELINLTAQLLSDEPLFFLVNSYTTGLSPLTMSYLLELKVRARYGGVIESGELGLKVTQTGAFLPCGASSRWYLK